MDLDPDFIPKPNKCFVKFRCGDMHATFEETEHECVYFKPQEGFPSYCRYDYSRCGVCDSKVAKMNLMYTTVNKVIPITPDRK